MLSYHAATETAAETGIFDTAPDTCEYILRYAQAPDPDALEAFRLAVGVEALEVSISGKFALWQTDAPISAETLAAFSDSLWYDHVAECIEYLTPNEVLTAAGFSDDTRSDRLWGMHNTGQGGGKADADIDVPEAWEASRGKDVLVAVIDTGIDYNHPDLAANIWVNEREIAGNGIDDDGNGFVDDVHGWDFANNDANPMDGHGHGTHVAGTIAAVADNGTGVTGVAPEATLMALKFLGDNGSGSVFDAIQALEYAVMMGADVSNNSWGGGGRSYALQDAIRDAGDTGHVYVAAAGNNARNTDDAPHYPSGLNADNIISVAASTNKDRLASFSNYGLDSVDVVAPGQSVYSTLPGGYGTMSGTSMATPHVTGTVALLLAQDPDLTPEEIRTLLIETSDPVAALAARSASGGRVNAAAALEAMQYDEIAGTVEDLSGTPLSGWRVFLDANGNGRRDTGERATLTDTDGGFRFDGLDPGTHSVVLDIAPGYLAAGQAAGTYRATSASRPLPGPDATRMTLKLGDDGSEVVDLPFAMTLDGQSFDAVTVSANGILCFAGAIGRPQKHLEDLQPSYSIAPFWTDLSTVHGGQVTVTTDAESGTVAFRWQNLRQFSGRGLYDIEAVLHADGDISFVYHQISGTPDLLTIALRGGDGLIWEADASDLTPGSALRLSAKPETTMTGTVTLASGSAPPDLSFVVGDDSNAAAAGGQKISGTVWFDADADGIRDAGEAGLAGRTVWLDSDRDGICDPGEASTVTGSDGSYSFEGLAAGGYRIAVVPGSGFIASSAPSGYALRGTETDGLTRATFAWHDIAQAGTLLPDLGDDGAVTLDLGWAFPFFGTARTEVTISANGYLSFGGAGDAFANTALSGNSLPGPLIAVFWDDLTTVTGGSVHTWSDGAQTIVQWSDVTPYDGGGAYTFQVRLHASGVIEMAYLSLTGPVDGATIGIAAGDGENALEALHDTDGLSDGFAFRFEPESGTPEPLEVVLGPYGAVTDADLGLAPAIVSAATPEAGAASTHFAQAIAMAEPVQPELDWL